MNDEKMQEIQKTLEMALGDSRNSNCLHEVSEKILCEYLECIQKDDYVRAQNLSRNLHKWIKHIKVLVRQQEDRTQYEMGLLNGVYVSCGRIISQHNSEDVFKVQMSSIKDKKDTKRILEYLYKHEYVQNKVICRELDLKPNLINKKMQPLIDVECVNRYSAGKNCFYQLSLLGKKYVKNVLGIKVAEVIDLDEVDVKEYDCITRLECPKIPYKEFTGYWNDKTFKEYTNMEVGYGGNKKYYKDFRKQLC